MLVGEVEDFAAERGPRGQLLGQQQVGARAVLDIEVVAREVAVRPDHRALAAQDRADRPGNDAVPVRDRRRRRSCRSA